MRDRLLAMIFAATATATAIPAPSAAADASPYVDVVQEAAARFGLPEAWIWAVMRAESAFRPQAVSRAGAVGLMQVMPQTYAQLRTRHGLGEDPFAPRDNILAGAAYLREMHDRFGAPGFLAAYNAGPARYEAYLAGRPLPAETRAYVAALAPLIGDGTLPRVAANPPPAPTIFVTRPAASGALFVGRATSVEVTP